MTQMMSPFPGLTDSEALGLVQHTNRPDVTSDFPYPELPPTPTTPQPARRVHNYIEDDEAAQAKRYWEQWVSDAATELLKGHRPPEPPRKELLVTAKIKPGPFYRRSSDAESVDTDISLLSTSSLGAYKPIRKPKKKKKAKKSNVDNQPEQKTDWVKLANERRGILDRMMRQDNSGLGQYGPGASKSTPSDVMSKEERALLMGCAYRRGISSRERSNSTMNILSINKQKEPSTETEGSSERLSSTRGPGSRTNSYGRTPSPNTIGRKLRAREHIRPFSAAGEIGTEIIGDSPSSSRNSTLLGGHFNSRAKVSKSAPGVMSRIQHQAKVSLPKTGGAYSQKVKQKVKATVSALKIHTGYGDPKDTVNAVHGEKGRFIDTDYARIPRYPQNIRVAPQLARVIEKDIHQRMGRPRKHEIRVKDVQLFEQDFAPLGRSQRNLLIFDWLLSFNEDDLEAKMPPEIYDLEGCPPRSRAYPVDLWESQSQVSSDGPSPLISEDEGEDEEEDSNELNEDDQEDDGDNISSI